MKEEQLMFIKGKREDALNYNGVLRVETKSWPDFGIDKSTKGIDKEEMGRMMILMIVGIRTHAHLERTNGAHQLGQ